VTEHHIASDLSASPGCNRCSQTTLVSDSGSAPVEEAEKPLEVLLASPSVGNLELRGKDAHARQCRL
jgi:hypothetical protein